MKKIITSVIVPVLMCFALVPVMSFAASYFTVDDSGNFGFGNSSPTTRIDVSGAMYSRLVTATSSAVNWDSGNVQEMTLTSSPTLTFTGAQAGGKYDLILVQDGTGSRTVTWPASVKWPGGTKPVLTSTANATDTVSFIYDGGSFLGTYTSDYKAPLTTLFSDNFNRTDSGSIGNGWSVATAGSGFSSGISGNKGFISWDQNGGVTAYRSDISPSGAFFIKTNINFTANHASPFEISYKGSAANPANGYGVMLDNRVNSLSIVDNGSVIASTSLSWGTSTTWSVETDYSAGSQNWIDVYVWDSVGGSKPSTPTLSFHNSGSNYTPNASGSNFSWGADNADASVTAYVSLFQVGE